MSCNVAANCGSVDSLNCRTRCGCRPWLRQMRCTEETLTPAASAIAAPVQWVASPGGSVWVSGMGLSGIPCAAGRFNRSRHSRCEALAEEDGELRLGHGPLARRHDPLLLG